MKLKLIYSHETAKKPVLSEIILETGIPMNILEARVGPGIAEMLIEVPEEGKKIEGIITKFKEAGINVKEITRTLEIDRVKCISCGACVSPCPVSAIVQKADWDVDLEEAKCIGCRICEDACPVRAIRIV